MLTELKFSGRGEKILISWARLGHMRRLQDLVAIVLVQVTGGSKGLSLFSSNWQTVGIETRLPNGALLVNSPLSRRKRCFTMTIGSQLKGSMAVAAESRSLQS